MMRVFLSYARADREYVSTFDETLKGEGVSTFMDATGLSPGASWQEAIGDAIRSADKVIVLWSRAAAGSQWVQREVDTALEAWSEGKLVLVRIDETELPLGLRNLAAVAAPPGAAGSASAARFQAREVCARLVGRPVHHPVPTRTANSFGWLPVLLVAATAAAAAWWIYRGDWQAMLAPLGVLAAGTIRQIGPPRPAEGVPAPPPALPNFRLPPELCEVFISYSTKDQQAVDGIVDTISRLNHRTWIYVRSPGHDEQYAAPIVRAIRSSRKVAVMCSDNAYGSDDVVRELYVAKRAKKPFVAFFIDRPDVPEALPEHFEYMLGGFPWIPVKEKPRSALEQSIRKALQS